MTSLIFGSIYMTHQAIVGHHRDKQRTKNYQRWEDLREEYDEQKKITRETRSLDIQRTGSGPYFGAADEPRPILTLRDQQEANDARMSWRPQESWEQLGRADTVMSTSSQSTATPRDSMSTIATTPSTYWSSRGELRPQKTGATWDDGLPAPLRVSRRSYDESEQTPHRNPARSYSVQMESSWRQNSPRPTDSQQSSRNSSRIRPVAHTAATAPTAPMYHIEPIESHVPGGRMAELIERGY